MIRRPVPARLRTQRGAALLMAMLTVALVTTLATAALWRQWRGVEIETAERGRVQARWILTGALDWGRLILRQDARSGGPDHLAEPWAIPLAEARLSTFLSGGDSGPASSDGDAMDAFLTGGITDLQGRLNAYNLVENGQVVVTQQVAFQRLFALLNLPQAELDTLILQLRASLPRSRKTTGTSAPSATPSGTEGQDDEAIPIAPVRFTDLRRLGLSAATLARLAPFATWLPARTTVNLNTAPVEVLYAIIDGIDTGTARKIEQQRSQTHFTSLDQVRPLLGSASGGDTPQPGVSSQLHSIDSRYFLILGQVRIDETTLGEQSVIVREGLRIRVLDRQPLAQLANTQTGAMGSRLP